MPNPPLQEFKASELIQESCIHRFDNSQNRTMLSSLRKPAAKTEVSIRKARKSTYTDPLRDKSKEYTAEELDDLKVYLADFYRTIYTRRDECKKICQQNPKTVGHFFDTLVPRHVTFEDFWQRYFYRCDPDIVMREWDRQAAAQKELLDRKIQGSMHSAQKLWTSTVGGAKKEPKDGQQQDGASNEHVADIEGADPFNPDTFMRDRAEALGALKLAMADAPRSGQTQLEEVPDLSVDSLPPNTHLPDASSDAIPRSAPDMVGLLSQRSQTRGEVALSDVELLGEGSKASEIVASSPQGDVGQPEVGADETSKDVLVSIEGTEDIPAPNSADSIRDAERAGRLLVESEIQVAENVEVELQEAAVKGDDEYVHQPEATLVSFARIQTPDAPDGDLEVFLAPAAASTMLVKTEVEENIEQLPEQSILGDGAHLLSKPTSEVLPESEPMQQLATETVSVFDSQRLATLALSSTSTKNPIDTTANADTKTSVKMAAKASLMEPIVANEANVRKESSSAFKSPPQVTISGNNEENSIIDVEQDNQNCLKTESSSTSEHPTNVTGKQEVHKAVGSQAESTIAESNAAASNDSTIESTFVEAVSFSGAISPKLSKSPSIIPPHHIAGSAGDQANVSPAIVDTEKEVVEGVKSDVRVRQSAQSFDTGTASIGDVIRDEENPSEESEAHVSSQAANAYKSRAKRLIDIRKTSEQPMTPTSVKKELEILRHTQGGSSVKNLKDFWARNEQSLSPAMPRKTITSLKDGVNNARPSSPMSNAQSLARPSTKPPAASPESAPGGVHSVEEATMIAETKVTPAPQVASATAAQTLSLKHMMSVADERIAPQPSIAECARGKLDPVKQASTPREEILASQAMIAESIVEPTQSLKQATAVVEEEPLGLQATNAESMAEPLDSVTVDEAAAGEISSPGASASTPEPKATPQKAMKEGESIEDDPLAPEATIAESTTADASKDQMSRTKQVATIVVPDATIADPANALRKPVKQETVVAEGQVAAPAAISGLSKEPANPVKQAPKVVGGMLDELATDDTPIRETPGTKVAKRHLMSFKNIAMTICVALLAIGTATTLWWHQDYVCAPAMGSLTHGRSEAPFWAPPAYKALLFGLLCGAKPEIQLQWIQTGGGMFTLVIEDRQSLVVQRKRLVSATVTPRFISVTSKRGKVEQLEAPWAFTGNNG